MFLERTSQYSTQELVLNTANTLLSAEKPICPPVVKTLLRGVSGKAGHSLAVPSMHAETKVRPSGENPNA
jgi:hypothetical protein